MAEVDNSPDGWGGEKCLISCGVEPSLNHKIFIPDNNCSKLGLISAIPLRENPAQWGVKNINFQLLPFLLSIGPGVELWVISIELRPGDNSQTNICVYKVKSHAGIAGNKYADAFAKYQASQANSNVADTGIPSAGPGGNPFSH
eukprot:1150133-Pelagomonas_calceolata.AAC.1